MGQGNVLHAHNSAKLAQQTAPESVTHVTADMLFSLIILRAKHAAYRTVKLAPMTPAQFANPDIR